ncbi:hypothetical protein AKO1_012757 [Acrasis kona]|uniref:F-box/LRR-repeat protein 15-like leucin rich repeat domain-containing protein n=1 Tax=Acrasis kona TaxID=1008807 RepID=A0AAW2YX11_9EUKA
MEQPKGDENVHKQTFTDDTIIKTQITPLGCTSDDASDTTSTSSGTFCHNTSEHLGVFETVGLDVLRHILQYVDDRMLVRCKIISRWFNRTCPALVKVVGLSSKELRRIGDDLSLLVSIMKPYDNITEVSFKGLKRLGDVHLKSVFDTVRVNLTSVKLWLCPSITDDSILHLASICPNLRTLHLNYCNGITNNSICNIATSCQNLRSLHLAECREVSDVSLISLSKNCARLHELRLTKTRITDSGLIEITRHCTRLQFLDVAGCDISDISIQHVELNSKHLKYLEISGCQFVTTRSICILRSSRRLQGLKLYYITDRGLNMASKNWVV